MVVDKEKKNSKAVPLLVIVKKQRRIFEALRPFIVLKHLDLLVLSYCSGMDFCLQ